MTYEVAARQAMRCFMQYAPALVSCNGDARCEDIQRRRPSVAVQRQGYEYWMREMKVLEAESYPGALASGLSFIPDFGG